MKDHPDAPEPQTDIPVDPGPAQPPSGSAPYREIYLYLLLFVSFTTGAAISIIVNEVLTATGSPMDHRPLHPPEHVARRRGGRCVRRDRGPRIEDRGVGIPLPATSAVQVPPTKTTRLTSVRRQCCRCATGARENLGAGARAGSPQRSETRWATPLRSPDLPRPLSRCRWDGAGGTGRPVAAIRVPCPPAIKAGDAGIPNLGACDVQPPLTRPCFRNAYNRPVSGAGPPSAVVWFHTPP